MRSQHYLYGVLAAKLVDAAVAGSSSELLTDLSKISRSWGQISNYEDNPADYFGVKNVGLPDGCQVEQVQTLQRHAQRFPTGGGLDGANDQRFVYKLGNYTKDHDDAASGFTGPLSFLSSYEYILEKDFLTSYGANTEFASGANFWSQYGRTLYDAAPGQLAFNASPASGSKPKKPVLRTTGQSRIQNSQINWALGFFGTSFQMTPNPTFDGVDSDFDVVIIPEGGKENNTLASYDSCTNDNTESIGYIGDADTAAYIAIYLKSATARLQKYVPKDFVLNVNDTYAMQNICSYEYQYIGMSDFCGLFTADEWAGFEHTLDINYYYNYGFGQPTGRAQGIGYVQELLARMKKEYITASNSSVNSSLTNNPDTFPLDRPFYADFSHDDIIVSVLTALSVDYFHDPPSLSQYPPDQKNHFLLSRITPFGARLITEVIGCTSASPAEQATARTQYYPTQYGYDAKKATHKFVRMRLNSGLVPLASVRGGCCAGRQDGLCAMDKFVGEQAEWERLANYQYACFANYTIDNEKNPGKDYDGTIGL